MKKFCNILILLAITVNAQIGIQTTNPTRALDVNGTSRIRALTDKSSDKNYDQVLTTDTNGNIDYVSKNTLTQQYVPLFSLTTLPTSQNNSSSTPSTISTQSITLPKKALVIINFSVPINLPTAASDGKARLLMTHLVVDGNTKVRASNSYTNSTRVGTNLTGFFYNTGSFSVELDAGTHSISLEGLCFHNIVCTQGGNMPGTNFQAVALYNDF